MLRFGNDGAAAAAVDYRLSMLCTAYVIVLNSSRHHHHVSSTFLLTAQFGEMFQFVYDAHPNQLESCRYGWDNDPFNYVTISFSSLFFPSICSQINSGMLLNENKLLMKVYELYMMTLYCCIVVLFVVVVFIHDVVKCYGYGMFTNGTLTRVPKVQFGKMPSKNVTFGTKIHRYVVKCFQESK